MARSRAKRPTLFAAILGSSVVFPDGAVVDVALPAIRGNLETGLAEQQWVVETYLLTLGSLILVGGSLLQLGERDDVVEPLAGLAARETEEGGVDQQVVTRRQVRVEADTPSTLNGDSLPSTLMVPPSAS